MNRKQFFASLLAIPAAAAGLAKSTLKPKVTETGLSMRLDEDTVMELQFQSGALVGHKIIKVVKS